MDSRGSSKFLNNPVVERAEIWPKLGPGLHLSSESGGVQVTRGSKNECPFRLPPCSVASRASKPSSSDRTHSPGGRRASEDLGPADQQIGLPQGQSRSRAADAEPASDSLDVFGVVRFLDAKPVSRLVGFGEATRHVFAFPFLAGSLFPVWSVYVVSHETPKSETLYFVGQTRVRWF